MHSKKFAYYLIDAHDSLSGLTSEEDIWAAAHKIADQVGANHINNADITSDGAFLWFRSSMPDTWLEEYVHEEYFTADPFVLSGLNATVQTDISVGDTRQVFNNWTGKQLNLNLGLGNAGYGRLICHSFDFEKRDATRFVTLCFENKKDILDQIDTEQISHVQSALSVLLATPGGSDAPGMVRHIGAHTLTIRERDVLCFLAQGMMTAKIAETMGIAEVTVNKHFKSARKRLGAATREQALAIAMASGVIHL